MKLLTLAMLLLPSYCSAEQGDKNLAPIPTLFAKPPRPGALTRFARLAGMFMGRVDVVQAGSMRMKFKLELR
jgi:hypothetical protein